MGLLGFSRSILIGQIREWAQLIEKVLNNQNLIIGFFTSYIEVFSHSTPHIWNFGVDFDI